MLFSKKEIQSELTLKRPLPTGITEFHEWAERIISGVHIKSAPGMEQVLMDSQKFALAASFKNLPPSQAFEEDAYFINILRKAAANQVAEQVMQDIRAARDERIKQQQNQAVATPPASDDGKVLEIKRVP